jgi:protein SCO1/2
MVSFAVISTTRPLAGDWAAAADGALPAVAAGAAELADSGALDAPESDFLLQAAQMNNVHRLRTEQRIRFLMAKKGWKTPQAEACAMVIGGTAMFRQERAHPPRQPSVADPAGAGFDLHQGLSRRDICAAELRRARRVWPSVTVLPFLRGACLLAALAPAAVRADTVYPVTGTVTAPLRDGELTVAHQEVPGYMPAMTMPFRVDPADQPAAASLARGDRVEFKLAVGDTSHAYAFRRTGHTDLPAAAAPVGRAPRLHEGDPLPAFHLTDQEAQPLGPDDLRGRWAVLTFIFTRCPVPEFCPRLSRQFAELQRRFRAVPPPVPRPLLVSISFDPVHDTPAVLKAYGETYGADPTLWRLCTGPEAEIHTLLQRFAIHVEPNGATLDHTLATALIAPDGRVHALWRGNQWTAADVVTAMNAPGSR